MAENKIPRLAIQMPDNYRQHFADMAADGRVSLTGLMSAMLLDLADDDRLAHGLPPLERRVTFRDKRA